MKLQQSKIEDMSEGVNEEGFWRCVEILLALFLSIVLISITLVYLVKGLDL